MQDERVTRAVELFQRAWALLSDLTDLRKRLPEPDMPLTGKLPTDWNEFRSYALSVDILRADLRLSLTKVIKDHEFRNEYQIQETLLPPSAKFPLHPEAWLDQRDQELGGEEPKGP